MQYGPFFACRRSVLLRDASTTTPGAGPIPPLRAGTACTKLVVDGRFLVSTTQSLLLKVSFPETKTDGRIVVAYDTNEFWLDFVDC